MEISNLLHSHSQQQQQQRYGGANSLASYSLSSSSIPGSASSSSASLSASRKHHGSIKSNAGSSILLPPLRETFGDILPPQQQQQHHQQTSYQSYSSPNTPPFPTLPSQGSPSYSNIPQGHYQQPDYSAGAYNYHSGSPTFSSSSPSSVLSSPSPNGTINPNSAYLYDTGADQYLSSLALALALRKRRQNLPKSTTDVLLDWLKQNLDRPYPNSQEKTQLVAKTGLSYQQLDNWFINARRRKVKSLKEMRSRNGEY